MTTELADLVAGAKAGDRKAFDELVRTTYTDTYALAFRLTGNEEDARDVVQDAYLRAFRSIGGFREEAQFTTWLYRITANSASSHLTRRSNRKHEELEDDAVLFDDRPEHDPEGRAEAASDRRRLNAALAALPERLRHVVVLRDIYDMSHEDIARELGISEATAKVRLHRARKKLRERLFPMPTEESANAV